MGSDAPAAKCGSQKLLWCLCLVNNSIEMNGPPYWIPGAFFKLNFARSICASERKLMFSRLLTLTSASEHGDLTTSCCFNGIWLNWGSLRVGGEVDKIDLDLQNYTLASDRSNLAAAVVVYEVGCHDLKCTRREQPSSDAGNERGRSNIAQQRPEDPYIILRENKTWSGSLCARRENLSAAVQIVGAGVRNESLHER